MRVSYVIVGIIFGGVLVTSVSGNGCIASNVKVSFIAKLISSIKLILFKWLSKTKMFAHTFRSPGKGLFGRYAAGIMKEGNIKAEIDAVSKLRIPLGSDVIVEIGAGNGDGLLEMQKYIPKRLVAVEISETFRAILTKLEIPGLEIYPNDCNNMSSFLGTHTVDRLLAMNVVYFLDPLEEYAKEFKRVLKPGTGVGLLGCKPQNIGQAHNAVFVNKSVKEVQTVFEKAGFDVAEETVELGTAMEGYVALIIRHDLEPEFPQESVELETKTPESGIKEKPVGFPEVGVDEVELSESAESRDQKLEEEQIVVDENEFSESVTEDITMSQDLHNSEAMEFDRLEEL